MMGGGVILMLPSHAVLRACGRFISHPADAGRFHCSTDSCNRSVDNMIFTAKPWAQLTLRLEQLTGIRGGE